MEAFHTPVLLQEIIAGLKVRAGKKYIDATLGGGGHGLAIVKRGGKVLGIDVDEEAIGYVKKLLRNQDIKILSEKKDEAHNILISQYPNITLVRGNFKDLRVIAKVTGFDTVSGILFDLGVSSHQFEAGERGFSFQRDGPLDMRMSASGGLGQAAKAADLVNGLYEHELTLLFQKYGEEQLAGPIARAICRAREVKPIERTGELARIIEGVYYGKRGATSAYAKASADKRVFQALRIAVNDELGSLKQALAEAVELLEPGGRIAVISFHSLEDRIVKQFFRQNEPSMRAVSKKPMRPTAFEIEKNPRVRSSKLRIYEKN